ncbi:MAG: hypothetical protein GF331_10710, partial [Chitinivibrionales bacterium]|nr:hypothetical protein [Chitinivibrionales bacterium]
MQQEYSIYRRTAIIAVAACIVGILTAPVNSQEAAIWPQTNTSPFHTLVVADALTGSEVHAWEQPAGSPISDANNSLGSPIEGRIMVKGPGDDRVILNHDIDRVVIMMPMHRNGEPDGQATFRVGAQQNEVYGTDVYLLMQLYNTFVPADATHEELRPIVARIRVFYQDDGRAATHVKELRLKTDLTLSDAGCRAPDVDCLQPPEGDDSRRVYLGSIYPSSPVVLNLVRVKVPRNEYATHQIDSVRVEQVSDGLDNSIAHALFVHAISTTSDYTILPGVHGELVHFSQSDAPWGTETIGNSGQTVANVGCAITSSAMLLRYYGIRTPEGQDVTPLNFLAWLEANNGFPNNTASLHFEHVSRFANASLLSP